MLATAQLAWILFSPGARMVNAQEDIPQVPTLPPVPTLTTPGYR